MASSGKSSSPVHLFDLPPSTTANLVQSADTFLFDLDGVIWAGQDLLPGVKEFLGMLKAQRKQGLNMLCPKLNATDAVLKDTIAAFFVSNNSMKSRDTYVKRFKELGLESPPKDHIYNSAYAAAAYLHENEFKGKAYVMGGRGITDELTELGEN